MKVFLALALAALTADAAWCGDLVVTKQKHTDAATVMGQQQPAQDSTEVTWIGKDRLRVEEGDEIRIVRADQKKMYLLDAKAKTYSAIDLPVDLKKYLPADMAPMIEAMTSKTKVTVTPTAETKKVGDWDTTKYTMTISMPMGSTTQDMWVAKIEGVDLTGLKDMYASVLAASPIGGGMSDEIKKIDGLPVLTERTQKMMGTEIKSTETVVSIEDEEPAAGLYDVPEGYVEKPFDPMADMGGPPGSHARGR